MLLLVIYVASQLASTYFMSATMERTQRYIFFALPFLFIPFIINFEAGLVLYWATTNLWTVGQGIVTRRLAPSAKVAPQKKSSRTPPPARPRTRRRPARLGWHLSRRWFRRPPPSRAAWSGRRGAAAGDDPDERSRGRSRRRTIGEAKWQAMRELERLHPGLDRNAVTFNVLGGRAGLLGVGTSPARVSRGRGHRRREPEAAGGAHSPLGDCCEMLSANRRRARRQRKVTVSEDDETCGSLLRHRRRDDHGREGRTINAIQHVMSSIAYRRQGPRGKAVEVDAGATGSDAGRGSGDRPRRRRACHPRRRAVRLEPMSAPERGSSIWLLRTPWASRRKARATTQTATSSSCPRTQPSRSEL